MGRSRDARRDQALRPSQPALVAPHYAKQEQHALGELYDHRAGRTDLFAGDSGYFIGYKEIGRTYPGIDYALMPVTAYRPRWFMHYAHMDVRESLDAFRDLGARFFVPTQWGTFHLGEEPPGYAALDLKGEIRSQQLDPSKFLVLDIGEFKEIR